MLLQTVEQETGAEPQWTVLWLHGLGADGHDFAPIVPELLRPHWPALRFVFPHAPVRPVTINNGVPMRAWYDIVGMDFASRAEAAGIAESVEQVEALIAREAERGIPASRLVLAGFSQGGAIALATGLRRHAPLAGLVALSTYLPGGQAVAAQRHPNAVAQPVFFAHGDGDPVIPVQHGLASAQALERVGFEVAWHRYPMAHQVCAQEIADLGQWLDRRLAG
ncbi:carboxylesterase [Pseudoxanthomonas broegbernensis]|uniref:Carboxylesterase n=1 Tax=Pseudoxanthomonas broegbernensis TaxID=83619 RepID=A0A7V8GKP9_9GAMM|nr:alpha/beta fold hydrolase [Pseudoxanthomonas broegbernensis]KAF1685244.1 carboxylesterase [Pseudoxanthomonas broegbernensis]MBB6066131.1 phospholipase/carboxylesterase [Pseudoxanthomonas broegbernensis]